VTVLLSDTYNTCTHLTAHKLTGIFTALLNANRFWTERHLSLRCSQPRNIKMVWFLFDRASSIR